MKINLVYFTGTGCTRHVAEIFQKELIARKQDVQLQEIRHGNPYELTDCDLLIICFVVHASNAPHPVPKWARNLSSVSEKPTAIISVSAGGEIFPNTACRVTLKRILRRRGYKTFYEKMIIMPSNWYTPTHPQLVEKLLEVLPQKISFQCEQILSGKKRITWPGPLNRFVSLVGKLEYLGARRFGKSIEVLEDCTGCQKCARQCPVGNITMAEKIPLFDGHCIMCLNCIYVCPVKALVPKSGSKFPLKEGFSLQKMIKVPPSDIEPNIAQLAKGPFGAGIRRYLLDLSDTSIPRKY